ncbi:MAG: pyrroline-5-carboxylate reductase [Deltaproteobacteria bacterium]|nr:pyrroline-5-carboxylate reductase [Deltaproteobacteria bacterium]
MQTMAQCAFVGAGNMGEALIKGLLASGFVGPERIVASEPRQGQRQRIAERYGVRMIESNPEAVAKADLVVLAVKPQILDKVLDEVSPALQRDVLVISIAAGKAIAGIEARLGQGARVVRAMPNVACLVGAGATGLAGGARAKPEDLALAQKVFDSVGMSVVLDESLLDAVTGLSGSGPAYIFMVIEALSDAGVKVGLSRWDAFALSAQTVLGAAKLVIETQEHPGRLKDMVCSPGGTAIAAVHTLEQGGLRTTLINAVEVATVRSRQLGGGDGNAK